MKTMKNVLSAVLIAALIMPVMQGCKKGPEDPGISLKSRDKKIVGIWNMILNEETADNKTVTNVLISPAYTDVNQTTTTTSYNGTTETETEVITNIDGQNSTTVIITTTTVTDQTVELTLIKDGTYSMTTTSTPKTTTMITSPANQCSSPLDPWDIPGQTCDGTFTEVGSSSASTSTGRWWWENSKKNKTHLVLDDDWGSMFLLRLSSKEMIAEVDLKTNSSNTTTNQTSTFDWSNYSKTTWEKTGKAPKPTE